VEPTLTIAIDSMDILDERISKEVASTDYSSRSWETS